MKKELAIKVIFNDFIEKAILNDNEKDVLIRYIKNDSITKIAIDTMQSERTISRIIADLKLKYEKYKEVEMAKFKILLGDKKV